MSRTFRTRSIQFTLHERIAQYKHWRGLGVKCITDDIRDGNLMGYDGKQSSHVRIGIKTETEAYQGRTKKFYKRALHKRRRRRDVLEGRSERRDSEG